MFNRAWFIKQSRFSVFTVLIALGVLPLAVFAQNQEMRIVSAGGSVTEIIFALGLGDAVIATDTSSSFPSDVHDKVKVGYYRQLSSEGVLSLNPTHLFAAKGAGPADVLNQIKAVGVGTYVFEQTRSLEGLTKLISEIGDKLGRQARAKALNAELTQSLAFLPSLKSDAIPVFLMSASERGIMAAGNNTVPHLLMQVLGIENVFGQLNGFKPISSEALLQAQANLIFIPRHQTQGMSAQQLCKTQALRLWSKIQGCHIEIVDSLLFLGLTPRLPEAAKQMLVSIESYDTQAKLTKTAPSDE